MATATQRPRAFLDIHIGEEPAGRLVIELFADKAPKTCANFLALCNGAKPPLTYKLSPFHRVIDEFMVQGGDITKGDGTGGKSIYGEEFEDENIGWRDIDKEGLVCMANRGKNTNSSQFFITLAPCPHLNLKHTVFGQLVSGQAVLERMAKVPVDKNDRPLTDVLISHCGELERRKRAPAILSAAHSAAASSTATESGDRERKRRRRSMSGPRSPSSSSSLRSRRKARRSSPVRTTPQRKGRRRSDAEVDGTLRGRPRHRSNETSHSHVKKTSSSPIAEDSAPLSRSRSGHGDHLHDRRRSPSPSRSPRRKPSRSRSRDPSGSPSRSPSYGYRRRRSLPNHYDRRKARDADWYKDGNREKSSRHDHGGDSRLRPREVAPRDGDHRYRGASNVYAYDGQARAGRLSGDGDGGGDTGGIRFKGRGSMKYRERKW